LSLRIERNWSIFFIPLRRDDREAQQASQRYVDDTNYPTEVKRGGAQALITRNHEARSACRNLNRQKKNSRAL